MPAVTHVQAALEELRKEAGFLENLLASWQEKVDRLSQLRTLIQMIEELEAPPTVDLTEPEPEPVPVVGPVDLGLPNIASVPLSRDGSPRWSVNQGRAVLGVLMEETISGQLRSMTNQQIAVALGKSPRTANVREITRWLLREGRVRLAKGRSRPRVYVALTRDEWRRELARRAEERAVTRKEH